MHALDGRRVPAAPIDKVKFLQGASCARIHPPSVKRCNELHVTLSFGLICIVFGEFCAGVRRRARGAYSIGCNSVVQVRTFRALLGHTAYRYHARRSDRRRPIHPLPRKRRNADSA